MIENNDIYNFVEKFGSWSMSDFQSRYFVVNSQVTDYRRVRQALLEIETRIAAKKQIERNVKKANINRKILERDIEQEQDSLKKELLSVDIEQIDYDISVYDKKYRICLQEIETFSTIIKDIVSDVETLETYKEHNDIEERKYWIARMAKQSSMDLLTIGRISQGNLDSICMMPLNDQEETIKSALSYTNMLNNGIQLLKEKTDSLPSSNINYIDEIVDNQLKLEGKVQSEDI